jgi:hypothetical protein
VSLFYPADLACIDIDKSCSIITGPDKGKAKHFKKAQGKISVNFPGYPPDFRKSFFGKGSGEIAENELTPDPYDIEKQIAEQKRQAFCLPAAHGSCQNSKDPD